MKDLESNEKIMEVTNDCLAAALHTRGHKEAGWYIDKKTGQETRQFIKTEELETDIELFWQSKLQVEARKHYIWSGGNVREWKKGR